jgi:hypothetical protein
MEYLVMGESSLRRKGLDTNDGGGSIVVFSKTVDGNPLS